MNSLKNLVFIMVALSLVGCDSGTGGEAITFQLALKSTIAATATTPVTKFRTKTGWDVTLTTAQIALGPVYIFENAPPIASIFSRFKSFWLKSAYAHTGTEHFDGGTVKGEYLQQVAFDLLANTTKSLGTVEGLSGDARSLSIELRPPRKDIIGNAAPLQGFVAYVALDATKDNQTIHFQGGLEIPDVGRNRSVDGISLKAVLSNSGQLTIQVDPKKWFDDADFSREDQVRTAWFQGSRNPSAFTTTWKDKTR